MAYCFAINDASVEKGFRRIAVELLRRAIDQSDRAAAGGGAQTQETIHELRKHCKKLRGLLRLVRPGFAGYRAENAAVRDAARRLSPARDAEILVETFDRLVTPGKPVAAGVAAVRQRLAARCEELARGQNAAAALTEFRDMMAEARQRARRWELEAGGFKALSGGLEETVERARKAMRDARRNASPWASPEAFHEWRKSAKDHWYHARLLTPVFPELMRPHAAVAEELGEVLGLHHDLSVLREAIGAGQDDAEAVAMLSDLAAAREAEATARGFALGGRLLAEEPAALAARWRGYWKVWCAEGAAPCRPD